MPFMAVHHEAAPGFGEDAEPLLEDGPNESFALGVFDGLGGAGGARYDVDGVERKGAYIAARLARDVARSELRRALASPLPAPKEARSATAALVRSLEERLHHEFKRAAAGLSSEPSKLRSSMVRVLPTTAGIALVSAPLRVATGGTMRLASAIWAGDSRVYVLAPESGLAQVSRDDIRIDADALTSLSTDPPIANCISASQDFTLRHATWELKGRCVVIAATDGCFGYLPTPAHFELELLDALLEEPSLEASERRLNERIASVTRDDATMAAAILDCGSFRQLQDAFRERRSRVDAEFVAPYRWQQEQVAAAERDLAAATAQRDMLVEARTQCAKELWNQYRVPYEQYLTPAPPAEASHDDRVDS